jgi:hypothetical protein
MSQISHTTRGGKRKGAGRKASYSTPKQIRTIRLPQEWIDQLISEFGTVQIAVETLVKNHLKV